MLQEMLMYHRVMVEILLGVMVFNLIIPYLLRDGMQRLMLWVRIGYFAFWALWSMALFAGVVLFIFTQHGAVSLSIGIMILVAVLTGVLDGYRSIALRRIWVRQEGGGVNLSAMIILVEIILLVAATVAAIKA